jgi:hypothetical protein
LPDDHSLASKEKDGGVPPRSPSLRRREISCDGCRVPLREEHQRAVPHGEADHITLRDLAGERHAGERVLHQALDRALERAGAELRVVALASVGLFAVAAYAIYFILPVSFI